MTTLTQPVTVSGRRRVDSLTDADAFETLRRTWQPVCLSRELDGGNIVSYTLLGEEIVVARLPGGLLAARDLCPHRGAKFGLGEVHDGHLRCPYHGWEFDASGACAKIPSLIDASCMTDAAQLQRYAAQERYGMVWVRLDDHELVPLPDVPEFEEASGWAYQLPDAVPFGCGFRREVENYLDMSHFAFAHRDTLGVAAKGQITDITITHFDDGFQMDAPFPVLDQPGTDPGKLQQSHHRRQRIYLPNFTTIRQRFHDGDERVLLHVPSPNSPTSCTVFWSLAISPGFDGPPPEDQIGFAIGVLDEDRVMVENQRPLEVPLGAEPVVLVPADRLSNTYKAAFRGLLELDHADPGVATVPRLGEATGEAIGGADPRTATLSVLYGSQTGNAENLANRLSRAFTELGLDHALANLAEVEPEDLTGQVLVLTSTYDNGDPPDSARPFVDALLADDGPDLSNVQFAVFGLGDRSYPNFAQCGKDVDAALERLGGRRLLARVDADTDYEDDYAVWAGDVLRALGRAEPMDTVSVVEDNTDPGTSATLPVRAPVVENRRLSRTGSNKEVRHYEVDLGSENAAWEPSDSLGVIPLNDPELVDELLEFTGWDPGAALENGRRLRTELAEAVELRRPTAALASLLAQRAEDEDLASLAASPRRRADLEEWFGACDVVDVLQRVPGGAELEHEEFLARVDPLRPRLYSIASSPLAHPGHAHLTVSTVRYEHRERSHLGVASTYLADRVEHGEPIRVFVKANPAFRPPPPGVDLIMIGPGTGVAPFRAFLQHREASSAGGRNWLFFGEQTREADYLYRDELEAWERSGHLSRLSLAFSRDQAERIYVQHRLEETAEDWFGWLEGGAHLCVCGDAKRMARDVEETLKAGVARVSGRTEDEARSYLHRLQRDGRYRRDVY